MKEVVLLTGATGFIGTWVAKEFLRTTDVQMIALVRAENEAAATGRLRRAWWDHPDLTKSLGDRIQVIAGDITVQDFGLGGEAYSRLAQSVTRIVHTAADIRLKAPLEELRRTNVRGTVNLLELAHSAHRHHGLGRFVHFSTAYIAGSRPGKVHENNLSHTFDFANAYEQTKYEAEILVKATAISLPVTILRPGMVVGDSRTGAIKTFNTLYFPLRLYLEGRHRILPVNPSLRVNMVPVDYVAGMAVQLSLNPAATGLTFHLTLPHESLPTVAELADFARDWARRNLDFDLQRPVFVPAPPPLMGLAAKESAGKFSGLVPYLNEQRIFCRENLDRLCGPCRLDWREYLPNLLSYATRFGFMHRSDRTVHEQIFFRLGSRSRPAVYCDIVEGGMIRRSAAELRCEIIQVAKALRASGIGPGDRVGITGLNGTRHFSIDTALGLIGAISVPIYYTSPPEEIAAIVADSDAKMLLLGAPALLQGLSDLTKRLPVVSFCRQIPPKDATGMIAWEEFLARGGLAEGPVMAHVDPDDVATIRYTSGTTGRPKGVVFTHRQLRWMAETVASLTPWSIRTKPVRYLSFLPLSHVVEGILGAYAPYFAPAPLEIHYLEEFHDLPNALRRARPTSFFCVPRFYEKLWEKATGNWMGKCWLHAPQSLIGRTIRPLLRHAVLRGAGLDRCGYLMVGSAPVYKELLRAFADLGIQVHNAYGLTEAPLITINRAGRVLQGTVGEPLPETEIRVAEDGEILARGPQVTPGYYRRTEAGKDHDNGWLYTGDLGRLPESGGLVITGRKKDLIVTAYGKNVTPQKVESEFRRLPGILEAMLIGEGRPYCTALLWVDPEKAKHLSWQELDLGIQAINGRLSHPEQAKSWAVLPYDLSVAAGDLTANLKLRREKVMRRLADALDALYGAAEVPGKVLHLGRAEI